MTEVVRQAVGVRKPVALNREAKLKKQSFDVPGFEAWNDPGTSVRT